MLSQWDVSREKSETLSPSHPVHRPSRSTLNESETSAKDLKFWNCQRPTWTKSFTVQGWVAEEMAQQLRALAALPEDWSSVPSTHVVDKVCNSSSKGSSALFWPSQAWHACGPRHICRQNTYTHKKLKYILKIIKSTPTAQETRPKTDKPYHMHFKSFFTKKGNSHLIQDTAYAMEKNCHLHIWHE